MPEAVTETPLPRTAKRRTIVEDEVPAPPINSQTALPGMEPPSKTAADEGIFMRYISTGPHQASENFANCAKSESRLLGIGSKKPTEERLADFSQCG
jgi:hypothetical protein